MDLPVPARLDAVRDGELDLALVRGPVAAKGVRVIRAWSEPLWAVVSEHHPVADRSAARLTGLDPTALRLPSREYDRPLHDAIMSALRRAGTTPTAARSGADVLNVLIEVGADQRSWTLLPAEQLTGFASRRVRAIPLDPPLSIDGNVVASLTTPDTCVSSFVTAFTDTATDTAGQDSDRV